MHAYKAEKYIKASMWLHKKHNDYKCIQKGLQKTK